MTVHKFGHGHLGPVRLDAPDAAIGQAAAQENEAAVGFGGIENETDRLAGMNANASGQDDAVAESRLKARLHILFRLLAPPEWQDRCNFASFRRDKATRLPIAA